MYPTKRVRRFAFLSVFFLCLSLTACGGSQAGAGDPIVGTWEMTEIAAGNKQVTSQEYKKAADVSRVPVLTFEENGEVSLDMDGESGSGTWTSEGGQYSITYKRGDEETNVALEMEEGMLIMEQDGYILTYEK